MYISAVIIRPTNKRNQRNKNTTLRFLYNNPLPIKIKILRSNTYKAVFNQSDTQKFNTLLILDSFSLKLVMLLQYIF